jgi:hypothetical protein
MPCETRWEPHGLYRKFAGSASSRDVFDSIKQVDGDSRLNDLRYSIFDCLEMRSNDLPDAERESLAVQLLCEAQAHPRTLIAFLTKDEYARAKIERLKGLNNSPYRLEVFATVVQARVWINRQRPLQDMRNWMHHSSGTLLSV